MRALIKLWCSLRTINRLIKKVNKGFIHGNRNRKPVLVFSENFSNKIIEYPNYNHFKDLLLDENQIDISYNSIYRILTKADFLSPKAFKRTRKNYAKKLKNHINNKKKLTPIEDTIVVETNILDPNSSHYRVPRSKYIHY